MSHVSTDLSETPSRMHGGLRRIWATWRYKYFEQPKQKDCFICRGITDGPDHDQSNLILVRDSMGVILLNRYPYSVGALMVAPRAHCATVRDLDDQSLLDLMHLVQRGQEVLTAVIHPSGYNIGINEGEDAGAGLHDHLHIHVVPRWKGDTNFMTTLAETRVMSESVEHMYMRLCHAIEQRNKN